MSIGELQEAIKTSNFYIIGIEEWYEVQTLKEYKCVSQIVTENILNIIKEKSSKKQKACIMPYRQEEKTSSLHPSVIKLLSVQSKEIMMKAKRHNNQVTCESTLREIANISTESLQPSTAWNDVFQALDGNRLPRALYPAKL